MTGNEKAAGLLRHIIRVLSANFWVAFIGFVSSFVFPKILTIDDYALYHSFTLYLTYITILHIGFPSGMVISYAGKNYDDIDRSQYKSEVKLVLAVLSTFTILFFALSIILQSKMLAYVALAIVPYDLIGSYKALLQAWTRFRDFSIVSTTVATAIPVIALLYYVVTDFLPGDVYICIYLLIYWIVAIIVFCEIVKKTWGIKAKPLFTKTNWDIEKIGAEIVIGNYINTLFVSADKQFVKWFFDNSRFAFYSFGMSMQALMTVYITSIAQPLFPAMAKGRFKDEEYNNLKEILIILGSLSGCAYFLTSIVVKKFIPKYVESLDVVGIYFVVFPAMAVVNCLYINLYKVKNLMPKYVKTLIGILCIAIVLNTIAVHIYPNYTSVSIATTVTYYIWFIIGFKQFDFMRFTIKDVGYLMIYTVGFFLITRSVMDIIGIPVYLMFVFILILVFYKDKLKWIIKRIKRKV